MKVLISKKDWIKATTDIEGKFYCPISDQRFLLNVWPDWVKIKINAIRPLSRPALSVASVSESNPLAKVPGNFTSHRTMVGARMTAK